MSVTDERSATSDEELVRRFQQTGALEALDELARRHVRTVRSMAYHMVLNEADADDLAQEVLLRAFRALLPDLGAPPQAEYAQLYHPIDELFSGWLLWLVESDRDIRLGLSGNGGAQGQPGSLVVVRTVVLSRTGPDAPWRRIWEVTAAARAEQPVDAPLQDAPLALWAFPLPDGGVAVDSALELRHPIALNINASNVFLSTKPVRVRSMQTSTAEVQVLQMVSQAPAENRGT